MKGAMFSLLVLVLVAFTASCPGLAQTNRRVFAESPDHPSTWVIGAFNIHQALRWSSSRHMLFADVKYSTRDYADNTHPTVECDYALSFPTVHFDASSQIFSVNHAPIGTLRHGFFGSHVVLESNYELDIRRHHGRIFAAIQPEEDP
jgi:hypothetical protein